MWTTRTFSDNAWREITTQELNGAFSSEQALPAVRTLLGAGREGLIAHLVAEIETVNQRSAIELWGSAAEEESRRYEWLGGGKVAFQDGALTLFAAATDDTFPARPTATAWHDRTTVIIPIVGDRTIEVRYEPELADEMTVGRMEYEFGTPRHELTTIFDWRGYFGNESAVIDGWTLMRRSGKGFVASFRGTTGFVVGNVMRRLSDRQPAFTTDPTMLHRLEAMEAKYPALATLIPRLRLRPPVVTPSATVFVHGTMSCALASLKDLYDIPARPTVEPTFRYEHDTFKPIHENGIDLGEKIHAVLQVQRLTMVAHSRGGLVARSARAQLRKMGFGGQVQILTVGTPHRGTPIVRLAGRALNMFLKLGEEVLNAIPSTSPLMRAYGVLWDVPGLPQGIAGMDEGSDAIMGFDVHDALGQLQSWGSSFDIMTSPAGYGVEVDGVLMGFMHDRQHDLVVPLESTLGFGMPAPPLNCSHSDYFKDPALQGAIAALQAPLGQPPQQPAGAAGVPAGAVAAPPAPPVPPVMDPHLAALQAAKPQGIKLKLP
jgi:hypothetical protein